MSKKIIYMVTVFLWLFTSLTVSAQTLSAGMTGQEVKELQKSLAEAGYLARTADGDYGSTTKKAVTEFQKDHGLKVTGTADDKTQAEIKKAKSGKRRKGGGIVYAKGNRGNMIADLQNKLRAAGYLKDQTDGVYGNATEAAVKKLQKDYNLPESGAVDEETADVLKAGKKSKKVSVKVKNNKEDKKESSGKPLQVGDRGKHVAALQNKLLHHGYNPGGSDGVYGKDTEKAVLKLQKDSDLKETGKADDNVLKLLQEMPQFTGKYKKVFHMKSTAYTPFDSGGSGMTALGNYAGKGHAAVDPKVIPLGSIVYIEGYGYAICDDIGGAIKGDTIDVGVETLEQAYEWGTRDVTVYLIS